MNTIEINPASTNHSQDHNAQSVLSAAVVAGANHGREPSSDDQSLAMVRNILFGEQVRDIERKHSSLDRLTRAALNALTEETQKKFTAVQQDIAALKDLLTAETKAREEALLLVYSELEQHEQKMEEQGKSSQAGQDNLHARVGREVERLEQRVADWRSELLEQLRVTAEQLRHEKADRKAVAGILNGMARQLFDGESGAKE